MDRQIEKRTHARTNNLGACGCRCVAEGFSGARPNRVFRLFVFLRVCTPPTNAISDTTIIAVSAAGTALVRARGVLWTCLASSRTRARPQAELG